MKFKKSVYTILALVSQIGISMVVPILLCTYVGVWLEERFSFPFTVILIVLGVLAGVRNVFAIIKRITDISEGESDEEG